jgi:hypothetical protein
LTLENWPVVGPMVPCFVRNSKIQLNSSCKKTSSFITGNVKRNLLRKKYNKNQCCGSGSWIRIRFNRSMPLTNESGFGSGSWIQILLFSPLTFNMTAKKPIF